MKKKRKVTHKAMKKKMIKKEKKSKEVKKQIGGVPTKALAVARKKTRTAPRWTLSPTIPVETMVRWSSYNLACWR